MLTTKTEVFFAYFGKLHRSWGNDFEIKESENERTGALRSISTVPTPDTALVNIRNIGKKGVRMR